MKCLSHNICVSITDCDLTSTLMQRFNLKTCILPDGQKLVTPLVSERNLIECKPMKKDPPSHLIYYLSKQAPDDFMVSVSCLNFEFVRKVDFWVSFPTQQILTPWHGGGPDLQSHGVSIWLVGIETQKCGPLKSPSIQQDACFVNCKIRVYIPKRYVTAHWCAWDAGFCHNHRLFLQ